MFESCKTLSELNQARVQAAREHPAIEVNNAYNAQRKRILESRRNFTQVSFKVLPRLERSPVSMFNYKGAASKPGAIEIREDGIYV